MTGVDGLGDLAGSITRLGVKLARRMRDRHSGMLDEMVETARGRVPVDTGTLLNGITGEEVADGVFEFRAEAMRGDENYARDVEFGHGAGARIVVADDDYFAGRTPRGGGGNVAAVPFFFDSANDVLHRHGHELSEIAPGVGREEGWEIR